MFIKQENPIRPVAPILDEAAGSSSSLRVKLRLPKSMVDEGTEEGDILINKNHVCKICKRSFSSGKALGGHVSSAHVQAQANKDLSSIKNLEFKVMKKNRALFSGSRCKICGKDFPSKKSLFGHMRSHPERYWRGMDPSEDYEEKIKLWEDSSGPVIGYHGLLLSYSGEEEGNDQVDSGPVVDSSQSVMGWVVTGKRGRPSYKPSLQLDEKIELHVAVEQLIRLVNDPETRRVEQSKGVNSYPQGPECEKEENRACGPKQKLIWEDGTLNSEDPKQKSMSISSSDDDDEPDSKKLKFLDLKCSTSSNSKKTKLHNLVKCNTSSRSKKAKLPELVKCSTSFDSKKVKLPNRNTSSHINPTPSVTGKFICKSCNKSFSTHQALGGHRSSHNKVRIFIQNTIDEAPINNKLSGSSFRVHSDGNLYTCEVCNKRFPTGQALGGHKKCHVANINVPYRVPPSSSLSTFVADGSTSTEPKLDPSSSRGTSRDGRASTKRNVLNFDLNEPAEHEEEAGR